jgi:tRNA-specific 2-thiouridylase
MKVLVGMSGGIDSSAVALLLQKDGHEVIGATMSLYNKDNPITSQLTGTGCFSPNVEQTIKEARMVCDKLGIQHIVVDCAKEYEKFVLDNFTSEYLEGRTPNPCVWCNSYIKFGALLKVAREEGVDFDKFATGHYVKVVKVGDRFALHIADDAKKDQSYFMYRLTQEQLSQVIFPLGGTTKVENRQLGIENGFFGTEKKESQDFYSGHYSELLAKEDVKGNIINREGKVLGTHSGYWHFTVGQRRGLNISSPRPLYVLELDAEHNEVIVGFKEDTQTATLTAHSMSWMAIENLVEPIELIAKIRSTSVGSRALVTPLEDNRVRVDFFEKQNSITRGQSVVFYKDHTVIGGGIIE